jgi:hypothetical protein
MKLLVIDLYYLIFEPISNLKWYNVFVSFSFTFGIITVPSREWPRDVKEHGEWIQRGTLFVTVSGNKAFPSMERKLLQRKQQ